MLNVKFTVVLVLMLTACAHSQDKSAHLVGGPCEGCEAIFEFGEQELVPVDTLPDFAKSGPKLKVTGIIYQPDGKMPASNVVLYIYHTNQEGIYETQKDETVWGKRHGYIRDWLKTDKDGKYTFYTLKPGTYPSRSEPAHIHSTILEPNGKYYWLDSYYFYDDPLLTSKEQSPDSPRGGSGVLKLQKENGLFVGNRDIILGLNIPSYEQ